MALLREEKQIVLYRKHKKLEHRWFKCIELGRLYRKIKIILLH